METITSRGQLVNLINQKGVETYVHLLETGKKILHTIIYDKKYNEFYRVEWGEIKDGDNITHLWYKENPVNVKFDKYSAKWLTKEERKAKRNLSISGEEDPERFIMKDGLIFINGETRNLKEEKGYNKVEVVAGEAGKGKSEYAFNKVAEALKKNKSVLFFALDAPKEEITRRIFRSLIPEIYSKFEKKLPLEDSEVKELNEAVYLLENAKLTIDENFTANDNYILSKMKSHAKGEDGLDLVIVDSLKISTSDESKKAVLSIHERMDLYRQELGCKVIITTQLNRNL